MFSLAFLWSLMIYVMFVVSEWLLISLLLLEIITFYLVYLLSMSTFAFVISDFIIICFFSVFVIEGVIGLAGLIILVTFTGSDYVSSSTILNC